MARSETVWSMGTLIPGVIFAATSSGIYRSIDFGTTWTLASDGISGTTVKVFADGHNPNIFYAATPGDGVFRSINAGITWSAINGTGPHALGNGTVRDMHQFFGVNETRLYVATADGMYAGTTSNGPIPGAVSWRKVTNDGLGNNTIFWALTNFTTTPGTMLAGTQSNGGYALTFTPPVPIAAQLPTVTPMSPVQGQTLTATSGGWTGTKTIEFEYQWQRCSGAVCSDIADATSATYVVPETATKYSFRVVVTGSNDFPTFGLATAKSAITSVSTANPATLPGANQSSTASITAPLPGQDITLPQSGDTLMAGKLAVQSRRDRRQLRVVLVRLRRQQLRSRRQLERADVHADRRRRRPSLLRQGHRLQRRRQLHARLQRQRPTTIFPQQATQTAAAKLFGSSYVGDTLVSSVGSWKYPGTTYTRQWEQCDADGTSCATISGAKSATYVVKADDLGHKLRVRVGADSNGPNTFPAGVEVFTNLSDVVTDPPPAAGRSDSAGRRQWRRRRQRWRRQRWRRRNGGGGGPHARRDRAGPASLGAVSSKLKPSAQLKLKVGADRGRHALRRPPARPRRSQGGQEAARPAPTRARSAPLSRRLPPCKLGVGGSGIVALPKRKLAAGDYRAVVTPIDAAGNRGAAKTIAFKVTKK